MNSRDSVTQESWQVYVLRDKFGRYYSRKAEPVTSLRSAWRFSKMEDVQVVMNSEYWAPAEELEFKPIPAKVSIQTVVEVEIEDV